MHSGLRSALMWLLCLALPFQGLAAVTMLGCGPMHERMAAAADAQVAAHGHAHDHARMLAGRADAHDDAHDDGQVELHADVHADAGAQAAFGASPDRAVKPAPGHQGPLGKLKCSACAACCVGAALPTAEVAMATVPPALTLAVFVKPQHVDVFSTTPDRPPRNLNA